MKARAHIFVSGRVQGVFFRSNTKWEADRQNVKGWVRNLTDGRVEIVLEGEKENVDIMIEFCRRGPPCARVENVDVNWEEHEKEFQTFKIYYF